MTKQRYTQQKRKGTHKTSPPAITILTMIIAIVATALAITTLVKLITQYRTPDPKPYCPPKQEGYCDNWPDEQGDCGYTLPSYSGCD